MLSEYGIAVRILDCSGFEDVGEMTMLDFEERRLQAPLWSRDDKLFHLIESIGSGSALK